MKGIHYHRDNNVLSGMFSAVKSATLYVVIFLWSIVQAAAEDEQNRLTVLGNLGYSSYTIGEQSGLAGSLGIVYTIPFAKNFSLEAFLNCGNRVFWDGFLFSNIFGDTIPVDIRVTSWLIDGGAMLKVHTKLSEGIEIFYRIGFGTPITLSSRYMSRYVNYIDSTTNRIEGTLDIQEFGQVLLLQQGAGVAFSSWEISITYQEPINLLFAPIRVGHSFLALTVGYRIL